jgi:hypothetical protein
VDTVLTQHPSFWLIAAASGFPISKIIQ